MVIYSAYGLTVSSEMELPGMERGEGTPDLLIRYGVVALEPPEEIRSNGYYGLSGDDIHYVWRGICRARIRAGEITVQPEGTGGDGAIANLLIGPFIALAMHQRGRLVMHGSGVEMGGRVVGFIGNSGQGKSTTAAAFMRAGYTIVTDDLLSVADDGDVMTVHPGSPQIKLWPESARAVGADPEELPKIVSLKEKHLLAFSRHLPSRLPLGCLYVLEEGEEGMDALGPNEALVELARHSYCAILVDELGDRRRHFLQCARLAARVPVRRLRRPLSLDNLERVVEMVEISLGRL